MFRRFLPVVLFLLALALVADAAWAQDAAAAAPKPKDAGGKSVIDLILHGGPLIIMIWVCIVGTSVVMVTFIIQNAITLRAEKLAPTPLVEALRGSVAAGNYQEAWETCKANDNYLANVLRSGLERLGRGKETVEDALAEGGMREGSLLRTRNSYLSVIGVVSPMIGLLGTVIGMMGAFQTLGSSGISDPRALASSIGEVLLATASGLFIAIPAFVAYYVFRNRAQAAIVHAEDKLNLIIEEIPFEELRGIKIGDNFDPGWTPAPPRGSGRVSAGASGRQSRKVSLKLTTNCPVCNGAIAPGESPCPHCSTPLDWN